MLAGLKQAIDGGEKEFDLTKYALGTDIDLQSLKNLFLDQKFVFAIPCTVENHPELTHLVDSEASTKQELEALKAGGKFVLYIKNDQVATIREATKIALAKSITCYYTNFVSNIDGQIKDINELFTSFEANKRYSTALWFSFSSAFIAFSGLFDLGKDIEKFFTSYNYAPTPPALLATIGLGVGIAHGFMGPSTNFRRMGAGILSAEIAIAGTCLASQYIENPVAKLVVSAAFLCIYTKISSELLSSERLTDAPKRQSY